MSAIIPFQFEAHAVRIQVDGAGLPWFNASDVCNALEMGNPSQAIKSHVDGDDLQKLEVIDNLGRTQRANHVNESGLYALIFGSRKQSAKLFKRWVTSEVLPAIRKNGQYVAEAPTRQRVTANFPFKTQWYDCPSRPIEEDIRKVEMLAQFAGLSRADKLTLLVKMVLQHDEYFATIVASARDRVKELDNVKDSPDAVEHIISAR